MAEKQDGRNLSAEVPCQSSRMDHVDCFEIEKEEAPKPFNLCHCILRHLFIKLCIVKFSSVHEEAAFSRAGLLNDQSSVKSPHSGWMTRNKSINHQSTHLSSSWEPMLSKSLLCAMHLQNTKLTYLESNSYSHQFLQTRLRDYNIRL